MSDDPIRAISRALLLLRTMNASQKSSLHDLHLQTGLAKSTIFRILHTLMHEGYVRAEGDAGWYRLTAKVQEMGAGYTEKSLVVDVGSPLALRVTRKIRWPLAIGTLDGDAIVVRYSTMPYSPIAVHATTVGQRLGLLDTAMGRVYLAHCPEFEREALCQHLRATSLDGKIENEAQLLPDLKAIRHQGYAVRMPNRRRSSATVAVPVINGEDVIATLCLTTFGRSLTRDVIARFVPMLHQTSAEISVAFRSRHSP